MTIDSALNYIRSKQQEQRQKRRESLDSTRNNNSDERDNQLTSTGGIQIVF
jgi:hypothetical protein